MPLERELATFTRKLDELRAEHEGKFVLIQGDTLVEVFTSYEDALKAGYARFGVATPFLVKRIVTLEQAQFISRFVAPTGATA